MYLMVIWSDANRLRLKLTGPIKKEEDANMEHLIRWKWSCGTAHEHLTWHGMVWVGNQLMLRIVKLQWVDYFTSQLCMSHPVVGEFMSGPTAAAIHLRENLTSLPAKNLKKNRSMLHRELLSSLCGSVLWKVSVSATEHSHQRNISTTKYKYSITRKSPVNKILLKYKYRSIVFSASCT